MDAEVEPAGTTTSEAAAPTDFVREAVIEDLKSGRFDRVHTRFPPEPNGYLHIGHAKAISIDFGIAREFGGKCNLRFDDTNPAKEETKYVAAMKRDIHWLGFDWEDREYYASDYFDQLYEWAVQLIRDGKAYVDSLSPEEIKEYRGSFGQPGRESPYRGRSVEENLDLFERMRAGEFPDGAHVLRAKIDMKSGNMNMRDPVMVPHPARRLITAPATSGASIPCTTGRTARAILLKASLTPCATWPTRTTGPLRLVPGPTGHLSSAADRVRPPQPHLHDPQQAVPAATRRGGLCPGLG